MNFSLLQNELRPVKNEGEYFYSKRTDDIMFPCTMERSNELCFYCLEGANCAEHPLRKVIAMGITCFADDDFDLVDEDTICHLLQFPDEKPESVESTDIQYSPSSPKCSVSAQQSLPFPAKQPSVKENEFQHETHQAGHFHEEYMSMSDLPRKRYGRFREKRFVCDVCDAAFTLKQNVQCHLFVYHVQPDGSMKNYLKRMYKCEECGKVSFNKSFIS